MHKKIFASLVVVLLAFSIMLVPRVQASSQTYWEASLPCEDVLLNQTLTTYKHDTYAEVGLSANLYVLEKDYPQPGQYEFALAVVAAANSRYRMGYTASYGTGDIYIFNEKILTLGDNEGAWVDIGAYAVNYYGAWYRKIFISSNGFVVFDERAYNDNGGKWTSPTPEAIPSINEPNVLVAPFWRDLDPSRGGSVKYGQGPYGEFVVVWDTVPNKANDNTQTFAVYFSIGFGGFVSFVYGSITNDVPTSIGIEDQTGKRGLSIPSVSSGQRVAFGQNSPDNFKCITEIKVSASKLTDSGTNDDNSVIHVDGLDNTLPGGVNVELFNPSEGTYKEFPIVSAATFALSTLALATGYGWLGIIGYSLSGANLVYQLSPVPSSTVNEADQTTQTAFLLNLAQDENRPEFWPWDVAVFALFRWRLLSASVNHRLVINVQVNYGWPTGSHTITTDNLELKLTPGSVNWYGRTNPDAHYYNSYQISTPYGIGYHIDSIGSNDYGYHMLGWSKLTDDSPEDYKVRPDGTIRVEGYFRQSDTFSLLPGRRLTNIYVMYSENINNIVKTALVLDYNDGTDWKQRSVVVSGLTLGKAVKIGVGRPKYWSPDTNIVAEWAGINIYDGNSFRLSISASSGGITTPLPGTYTYGYGSSVTVTATAYTHYVFDHWVLDGATVYGNGIALTMDTDHNLMANFKWVNNPPNNPSISGSTSGYTNGYYTYYANTTDPDGDDVCYKFDWGDGTTDTTGWYASGATASKQHIWGSSGTYYVKVQAQDSYGAWSGWSSSLTVSISSGGGGGGCPTLFVWNGTSYESEGILNIHAESDVTVQHEIQNTLALENGVYKLQLRELDNFTSHIDQVKLYAIDNQGKWHLCPLTYAYHNELGKVTWRLFFDDEKRVDLTPTQTTDLKFLPSIPYGKTVGFIFEINGYNDKPTRTP